MVEKDRIAYIQHAASIGGSTVSLLTLVKDALRTGYACHVICQNEDVANLYQEIGAETSIVDIVPLNHNTVFQYRLLHPWDVLRLIRMVWRTFRSLPKVRQILREVHPDVVHLNSSVLPQYAVLAKCMGFPVVWHIRETIVRGHWGIRQRWLARVINRCADRIIYISEQERDILNTDPLKSMVVYNYVHEKEFMGYRRGEIETHEKFVVLSLGGVSEIKGTRTIVAAAGYLDDTFEIRIMGAIDPRQKPACNRYDEQVLKELQNVSVGRKVQFIAATPDVRASLFECDVLVFWGLVPHFPRPVFEAWLMGKPVLVYDHAKLNPYISEATAAIIREDTPSKLAAGIVEIKRNYPQFLERATMGRNIAAKIFGSRNFDGINSAYQELIGQKSPTSDLRHPMAQSER